MATFGLRKSAWDAATADQRKVLKVYAERVDLGDPAVYRTAGNVVWLLCDDIRFDITDAATFAVVLRLIAQFDVIPNGRAITRSRLLTWIANHGGIVVPETIPAGEDPFDYAYQQNGGPVFGVVRTQVPSTLAPVVT